MCRWATGFWEVKKHARFASVPSLRPAMQADAASSTEHHEAVPTLVVLGGRGFVGSAVCHEALATGMHVVGLSRSGRHQRAKLSAQLRMGCSEVACCMQKLFNQRDTMDTAFVVFCHSLVQTQHS